MSDTERKRTQQPGIFYPASSAKLSHPAEFKRPPAEAMSRSQDSGLAGYRVLLHRTTGGSHEWLVDNTPTGGGSQGKPDGVTWRRVTAARVEQQAGTALLVRVVYVPSGASEFAAALTWDLAGVGGQTRVLVDWATPALDTASAEAVFTLDGEDDPDGAEKQDPGAQWGQLRWKTALILRPPRIDGVVAPDPGSGPAANDYTTAVAFAEHVTTTIAIEDKGGARVVHMSVSEIPIDHIADHEDTTPSLTGSSLAWETDRPQIEAPDGATYEEHRYGIFRSMDVAARQSERIGPIIAQWSAYSERSAAVTDTDVDPETTTSATYVRLGPGLNTAWDTDEVGWFIMGTKRAPENLPSRITGAASIPVRVRAFVRFAGAGAVVGLIRFQSSSRSWIELKIDQAAVGTTWQWVTITGWLESSVASDDFWPILQLFWHTDGVEQLECRYWTVSYGEFAVGA